MLRVESAFLANCILEEKILLNPTIKMTLTEINMCQLNSKEGNVDINGMMAELLSSEGIVVKNKGEGFA